MEKKIRIEEKIFEIYYSDLPCNEKQEKIRELEQELNDDIFEEI